MRHAELRCERCEGLHFVAVNPAALPRFRWECRGCRAWNVTEFTHALESAWSAATRPERETDSGMPIRHPTTRFVHLGAADRTARALSGYTAALLNELLTLIGRPPLTEPERDCVAAYALDAAVIGSSPLRRVIRHLLTEQAVDAASWAAMRNALPGYHRRRAAEFLGPAEVKLTADPLPGPPGEPPPDEMARDGLKEQGERMARVMAERLDKLIMESHDPGQPLGVFNTAGCGAAKLPDRLTAEDVRKAMTSVRPSPAYEVTVTGIVTGVVTNGDCHETRTRVTGLRLSTGPVIIPGDGWWSCVMRVNPDRTTFRVDGRPVTRDEFERRCHALITWGSTGHTLAEFKHRRYARDPAAGSVEVSLKTAGEPSGPGPVSVPLIHERRYEGKHTGAPCAATSVAGPAVADTRNAGGLTPPAASQLDPAPRPPEGEIATQAQSQNAAPTIPAKLTAAVTQAVIYGEPFPLLRDGKVPKVEKPAGPPPPGPVWMGDADTQE